MIDRLPPQSIEAEQSVLGAILIDRDAMIEIADFLKPEDFYRQAHGRIYAVMLDLSERREPIDIVTVVGGARAHRGSRGGRWARVPRHAVELDADRRPRGPVRADRGAEVPAAEPHRRRRQDRRHRLRGPGGDPGGDRPGGGGAVRGQPAAGRRRLLAAQEPAPRRLRPAGLPPRPPRRDQRHPDRLRGPRHADDRAPEERPRDPRGPAIGGQDQLRAQHRGARRREGPQVASASSASR